MAPLTVGPRVFMQLHSVVSPSGFCEFCCMRSVGAAEHEQMSNPVKHTADVRVLTRIKNKGVSSLNLYDQIQ